MWLPGAKEVPSAETNERLFNPANPGYVVSVDELEEDAGVAGLEEELEAVPPLSEEEELGVGIDCSLELDELEEELSSEELEEVVSSEEVGFGGFDVVSVEEEPVSLLEVGLSEDGGGLLLEDAGIESGGLSPLVGRL